MDGQNFAAVEEYRLKQWLGKLALALKEEAYRPASIRRLYLRKANGKLRPLGISTLRDWVLLMTAAMLVLELIVEADLLPEQCAYRPEFSAQQAVVQVQEQIFRSPPDVVDADLTEFVGSIPHANLPRRVLHLHGPWKKPMSGAANGAQSRITGFAFIIEMPELGAT